MILLTALFLVALLKSDMSCLYGPRLNPEKYLASIAGGDLLGVDTEAYSASRRSFLDFRSFGLYASGSSFRDGLVRPLAISAQNRLPDGAGAVLLVPWGSPEGRAEATLGCIEAVWVPSLRAVRMELNPVRKELKPPQAILACLFDGSLCLLGTLSVFEEAILSERRATWSSRVVHLLMRASHCCLGTWMIVTCCSDVGSGELGIETAGLVTAGVLLSWRARTALNRGFTNEKKDVPAMRCRHELFLHLIAGPALVLPFRMKVFWLLHFGQTSSERPKSNAFCYGLSSGTAGRRSSAESTVQGYFLRFREPQEEEDEDVMFQNARKTL